MKELKFRAWDKVTKRYYAVSGLEYDDNGNLCEVYLAGIQISESDPDANVREPSDVILEQYTGLKDKNGKEIYEGDIVDYNDDGECIGVVEYDAPEFCLNADATNWARMFLKGAPHQRVIGNIHENPELIKEKE